MTNKTITAMFDSYGDAASAVSRLESAGIPHGDISIVSNDTTERDRYDTTTGRLRDDHPSTGTGAGTGATVGTVLGGGAGLLAGLGLLAIPGLGPVVAAGWLASTLLGAGIGAAAGGTVGALTGAGVDEAHAHSYAEGVRRGGTLVTVRADESRVATVTDILDDEGTVDMGEREATWRRDGWTGRYSDTDGTVGSGSAGTVAAATGLGGTGVAGTAGMTGTTGTGGTTGLRTDTRSGRVRVYPAT